MNGTIKFSSEILLNKGKTGLLSPDADGYYELIIGGINCFNSCGEYYAMAKSVEDLFKSSSTFMRKVKSGKLYGELEHPEFTQGMDKDSFIRRIYHIDGRNVICQFKDIWLDLDFGKKHPEYNNPDLIAIMAKVIPHGVHEKILRDSLTNKFINPCFSIRSITNNYYHKGTMIKEIDDIITFDYVSEGGIAIANKWDSPALESRDSFLKPIMKDIILTKEKLLKIYNDIPDTVSVESNTRNDIMNTVNIIEKNNKKLVKPIYVKW